MRRQICLSFSLAGALWSVLSSSACGAEPKINFTRDIRPILSNNCFQCHGPDDNQRKAGLRLDVAPDPNSAKTAAIVAGQPDESELILRLVSTDPEAIMPPAKTGKKLTEKQIELLKQWVAEGASYQGHWAFSAPQRPAIPEVRTAHWSRNPIDRFVLARLEQEGLTPAGEADEVTLLRRIYLDLIGLPPTVEEVDAYLADKSPEKYREAVERLLKSPHYGERWARHWLDAARYADSDGFEKDKSRQMFFYRDYVIQAFNQDLPYNQFLIEQLAGDLLPEATQDQIVATGFLRNSMVNEEGGVDPEQFRMDAMFDRMDAIGKSILGLTIQCAQCHTHKYDPITQTEYYRLFAFLNNDHEAQRVVYTPEQLQQIADLTRQMRELEMQLQQQMPDWQRRLALWAFETLQEQPQWETLKLEHQGDNGQRYLPQPDGSVLAQGYAPTKFTAIYRAATPLRNISALQLELLNDPNLPCNGPGRSFMGTCALSEITIEAAPADKPDQKTKLTIAHATADVEQEERDLEQNFFDKSKDKRITGPISLAVDGDAKTAWGIDIGPGRRNQPRKAVFQFEQPVDFEQGTIFTISLQQNHGGWNSDDHMNNNLGRFRLSVTDMPTPVLADPVPAGVRAQLARVVKGYLQEHQAIPFPSPVFSYWRTTIPEWQAVNDKIEALWQAWPAGATSLTLMARQQPRDTRLLNRGDWLKPTDSVTPGVPEFLHPLPAEAPLNRLTFARWIADPHSPTTARVFVNRVWQAYFGTGIVSTAEDFGVQSESPSHRELLDWLAVEFMEENWSIKDLHRLIVNSATYRQASQVTPELLQRDPYNHLLARGPRFRVEGEIVRDIALAASGLLNPEVGGKSRMPPAPAFLFQPPTSYAPFPWVDEKGPEKYRRAIYTFRRRSTPFPMLQTFDVPNADSSCVRRQRSNSPLQALVALNEPLFVECAQSLARQTLEQGGADDPARLTYAFRRVLSRQPTAEELHDLQTLLQHQQKRLAAGELNANQIATGSEEAPAAVPADHNVQDWAAYTIVARVLLNLDETITKE